METFTFVEALVPLAAVISIFVVLPWIILHYTTRRRELASRQVGDSQAANADLAALAEKLETRVQALETILDAEVPGWRSRMS